VFGRRAALKGLDDPEGATGDMIDAAIEPPTPETRAAVWRLAGLERDAPRLRELHDDPHPLARLVGASALAREETRGAHGRAEFPDLDPRLDQCHTLLDPDTETPRFEAWTDS
jgi:L-aspartate oxidase